MEDFDRYKYILGETIMLYQFMENDLKLIYAGMLSGNFYKNLEWCSRGENLKHSYQVLNRAPNIAKNSQKKVAKIFNKEIICIYNSIAEAARENKTSSQNISACVNKRQKTAGGFSWEAVE